MKRQNATHNQNGFAYAISLCVLAAGTVTLPVSSRIPRDVRNLLSGA